MKSIFKLSLITAALVASQTAFAENNAAEQCVALKDAKIRNVQITSATWSADGSISADKMAALTGGSDSAQKVQPHCVVEGEIEARTGADGKHYGTKFQLRLPQDWNNRFLFQGGGGLDGFVAPAVGNIPVHDSTAQSALERGYAVVSMDGGHPTPTADFGADQQARLDYAYQSIGKVTTVAKELIGQNYQKAPKNSFFMGCSNGGREAMLAAQRYPLEFDGVIAANPGFRLSRAAIAEVWDTQQFMKIAPKDKAGNKILANALTQADLDKLSDAVLAKCDAKDGLKDGIINAWESCDFDPTSLDLPKEKIAAIKAVFDGAKTSQGEQVYSGWYYDSGVNQDGWRSWKLGDSQTAESNARNIVLGGPALTQYYFTPADAKFDLAKFDFDKDPARTAEVAAVNDAVSTMLNTFQAKGGKLIVVTGVSDPVFSAKDQVNWFKQMQHDTANAENFSRLFLIPGMTHCGGGKAFGDVDPLTALEKWTDNGTAPDSLIAKSKTIANKSMPICAYPKVATYVGGDESKAESFECK